MVDSMRAAQRYDQVVITGLAHLDAPHVVGSTELEDRLGDTLARLRITPGLLEKLSGIVERRVWDEGTRPSEVAARAGEEALARSGVDRDAIGALIAAARHDQLQLARLKKRKLLLKDEIARVEDALIPDIIA